MHDLRASALSLSALVKIVVGCVLLAILGGAVWQAGPRLAAKWQGVYLSKEGKPNIARRRILYRLDAQKSILFRFGKPVKLARVLTNPTVNRITATPGKEWIYAVRAELLASDGRVVAAHIIYARCGLFTRKGTRVGAYRFYKGNKDAVATADEIRLASDEAFTALRLTSAAADPDILSVDVRIFERRPIIEVNRQAAFTKLSPDDKNRLAQANAFPSEMLTPLEKANAALNQWRPVGPVGVEGRDYNMRILYENARPVEEASE